MTPIHDPDQDDTPESQRVTPPEPMPAYVPTVPPSTSAMLFVLRFWQGLKR